MTKILHTSDWHLGHVLYGYDREDEQRHMLRQVQDIVSREQPDIFLLPGDIYHNAQAPAPVQRLFADTLVNLHALAPKMDIVVTAGNHDSGARHDIFRTPWEQFGVHSFGVLDRDHLLDHHILHFPGKAWIIALPYFYSNQETFKAVYSSLVAEVSARNTGQEPVVAMAHITVSGADFHGHRLAGADSVGGLDAFSSEKLEEGVDYLALGHIHHAQNVGDDPRMRYSGSPLAVSFDENYEHSLSLITLNRHGDEPELTTIPLEPLRQLKTLPQRGFAPWEELLETLKDLPDEDDSYIRLNVTAGSTLPATPNVDVMQAVKGKQCRFCLINLEHREDEELERSQMNVQQFQQASPLDIIKRYARETQTPFTDDMETLFRQVMNEVKTEEED